MLEIKNKISTYEFNYEGLKIFESENTTKTYKNLFYDSEIKVDNKLIKTDNIVYINELTKISDLIDLSKKSTLMHSILDYIHEYNILNTENINLIKEKINQNIGYEILESKESDIVKIITLIFELLDNEFLNEKIFKIILDKMFTEKKFIILDNVSWLNITTLENYLNIHNFIVLVNDIRNINNVYNYLECYVNENFNEFLDVDILINYLQRELKDEHITYDFLQKYLNNKENITSYKIHNIIKKI